MSSSQYSTRELRAEVKSAQDVVVPWRQQLLAAFLGSDGLALDVQAFANAFWLSCRRLRRNLASSVDKVDTLP